MNKKAFCVLEFAKTESIVTVQRKCLCAAKQTGRPGPEVETAVYRDLMQQFAALLQIDNGDCCLQQDGATR